MKRFTKTWTLAVASAVLMASPATGAAQTPQTSAPATASAQSAVPDGQSSAQEHLRKASAALGEIKTAALPARAKNEVAEIKRRVASLERTTAATDMASASGQANRSANAKVAANWGTEVAAIDKALTGLLGPDSATPSATGTTGTAGSTTNKAAATVTLDAGSRASLTEARKHLTAYATAMAGGKTDTDATPSAATATQSLPATATATASSMGQTAHQQGTQPPTQADPAVAAQASGEGDPEAAREHLTAARNTLSALTQLPAAAQLSGEARTQVAQLISTFNELITTQSQWRDSYAKVNGNLTALLGPDSGASDPTNAAGTAGAVGTSGAAPATIDPAVREKLVELRRHLTAFEKVASGGTTATTTPSNSSSMTPTIPTSTPDSAVTAPAPQGAASGSADVMRHVAAIEGMLKMQDESGGLTLTKAQVEQLRTHWAALRTAIEK